MAAEGTEIPSAPVAPETTNGAGAEEKKSDAPEKLNQANGNSDSTEAEQTKPTEESKPAEEAKTPEQAESAASDSKEPPAEEKTGQSKAGDKREHDTTSAPTAKKQKTDEDTTKAENGDTNGEKKKAGRPKKIKETAKKDIPTDGIGSRTRSRTKAT